MASTLATTEAQGPMLFEDLAVYFSQEECVSLNPVQRSLSRDATQEGFEDVALMGEENKTEVNHQLSLESVKLEELTLDNYPITAPLVQYSENSSEDGVGNPEGKIPGAAPPYKKKFISLLVTIENHTPLVELSQCLGTRTLSEILEFPWEEANNVYKCPECDQSFSDNSYLLSHQKIHSGDKKYKCGNCGKIFNHRANLRTHSRIHTGKKPYKRAKYSAGFRRHSYLSRHKNSHIKKKPYTCSICARGFMLLPGLTQHQKTHNVEKPYECANLSKYFSEKTDLPLDENTHTSSPQYQYNHHVKSYEEPSYPALPEKAQKEDSERHNDDDDDFFSFSRFKPLQCSECDMTFPSFFELISHQDIHAEEKPRKCKTCEKSFTSETELICHQKSHTAEEPFKCTVCGKSFRVIMHLITHKRTHMKNTK
ncbi:zinc finger protein 597 [Otolemur garnettii]|uniref:Zinc finger protein 597 n=1 Tax=Otolemur garnettii TaxID=30611 RepID=H0XE85_OTOGA|nr:zinc finger protein 597 [Otolemur garnettii]